MDTPNDIKRTVREKYAAIALQDKGVNAASCCGSGPVSQEVYNIMTDDYSQLKGYAPDADLGLGCGLPTAFAGIKPGDTVLDLGSGAGNDCFIARAETGEDGRVIGVDFTPEMIMKARANAQALGYGNVEFRQGDIEALPVSAGMVDVVVSNCVLNLVPDKAAAFAQMYRVLKPGGHFSISDVVLSGTLPAPLEQAAEMYVGCVSGAIQEADYLELVRRTGFTGLVLQKRKPITIPDDILRRYLHAEELEAFRASGEGVFSITLYGVKPDTGSCCAPNAEGTAKVKVATGEECGCGIRSTCC